MTTNILRPIQNSMIKDQATAAIEGMLPAESAPSDSKHFDLMMKLRALEELRKKVHFYEWRQHIRILQAEVAELVLAYMWRDNQASGETVRAASYDNFVKTVGSPIQVVEFQKYLAEKFNQDVLANPGMPALELAKLILSRFANA